MTHQRGGLFDPPYLAVNISAFAPEIASVPVTFHWNAAFK